MDWFYGIIGADANTILWWQMVCRGILIFFYTLFLIRIGGRRIFGKATSFDIVLGVILGSIMSRALTANARFFPTLAAATALVFLHWLLAGLSRRSRWVDYLVKGTEVLILRDGKVQSDAMRKTNITKDDLMEALRSNGGTSDLAAVKAAYLERSGDVSVVTR